MENNLQDTEETVRDVRRHLSPTASQAEWREGELAQCARQSHSARQ